jgi:hypothetical protein
VTAVPAGELPEEYVATRQRVKADVLSTTDSRESAISVVAYDLARLAFRAIDFNVVPGQDDRACTSL